MQGYGTFESPDGARYSGGWQANLKHGIGKKVYANGDSYEGLWHSGKAEGPGRCGVGNPPDGRTHEGHACCGSRKGPAADALPLVSQAGAAALGCWGGCVPADACLLVG